MAFTKKLEHEDAVIITYSGLHIDLLNPEFHLAAGDLRIDDIATSLCRQCRFVGHIHRDSYSVGEHLLLGLDYCTPAARFAWLLHDATEAYLGDVSGPLKAIPAMHFYRDLEEAWANVIVQRFGPAAAEYRTGKFAAEVRTIDGRMLATEKRDLKGMQPLSTDRYKAFPMRISPAVPSSEHMRERFLAAFYELAAKTPGAIR